MAFVAPLVGLISAGVSAYSTIKSLTAKPAKPPEPKPLPAMPTQQDTQDKAAAEVQKRRRISLLSGGNTNATGGNAILQPGAVGMKTLTGQ